MTLEVLNSGAENTHAHPNIPPLNREEALIFPRVLLFLNFFFVAASHKNL
jgi:hypothetical protein